MLTKHNEKMCLRDTFLQILTEAAKKRPERQSLVRPPLGSTDDREPQWAAYERQSLFEATNLERSLRGETPLSLQDIIKVERQATGHSDYAAKFALGCAELVVGP
jgi:hypothetical protein